VVSVVGALLGEPLLWIDAVPLLVGDWVVSAVGALVEPLPLSSAVGDLVVGVLVELLEGACVVCVVGDLVLEEPLLDAPEDLSAAMMGPSYPFWRLLR
jgi:hypothetical protein